MAVLAFKPRVTVLELEFGVPVMVEGTLCPVTRCMAAFAFLSVAPLMLVVSLVALKASLPEVLLVEVSGVATNALGLFVPTNKSKSGLRVMIEGDLFPSLRRMAGLTLLAITPAMAVIQPVTVRAFVRGAFVALIGVTAFTAHLLVSAL